MITTDGRLAAESIMPDIMPEKKTIESARKDKREGKAPSTQAGEFVREEMEHIREGKHGARSAKQAIAIGLSKARRAGVKLPSPENGAAPETTRRKAKRDLQKRGAHGRQATSRKRSRATMKALKREGRSAASKTALKQAARGAKTDSGGKIGGGKKPAGRGPGMGEMALSGFW